MFQSGRAIKGDAKFLALGIGSLEIFLRPLVVFADQFHIAVPGLRDFFQPMPERQVVKDGPKHDGDLERHPSGLAIVNCGLGYGPEQRNAAVKSDSTYNGSRNSRSKCSWIYVYSSCVDLDRGEVNTNRGGPEKSAGEGDMRTGQEETVFRCRLARTS